MNVVLQQLVPGLTISIKDMGAQLYPNGTPGHRIQLMSDKNSREIPMQYESEGIKKLISVLQLLIAIYNKPSMTVAIDELDSGVFEYLLGEILRIHAEKGNGQLVFTSHNLRDFYYRDIILGEQSEPVYEPTNNSEIAMAFKEAGDPNVS